MLKELSKFTQEPYRNLKRQWNALPGKSKPRHRRKILATLIARKEQQAQRKERFKNLPVRP
jgi:hypothetical protein